MSSLTRLRRITERTGGIPTVAVRNNGGRGNWFAARGELRVVDGELVHSIDEMTRALALYTDIGAAAKTAAHIATTEQRYRCDALGRLTETDAVEVLEQIRRGL